MAENPLAGDPANSTSTNYNGGTNKNPKDNKNRPDSIGTPANVLASGGPGRVVTSTGYMNDGRRSPVNTDRGSASSVPDPSVLNRGYVQTTNPKRPNASTSRTGSNRQKFGNR